MSRIELRALSKRYGQNPALNQLDLTLEGQKIVRAFGQERCRAKPLC
ncbi:MAG: hypothetical protein ACOX53_06140 [Limnochordia bacterium]